MATKDMQAATVTVALKGYGTDDIQPLIDKMADKFIVNVKGVYEDRKPGLVIFNITYKGKGANRSDINTALTRRFGDALVYIDETSAVTRLF